MIITIPQLHLQCLALTERGDARFWSNTIKQLFIYAHKCIHNYSQSHHSTATDEWSPVSQTTPVSQTMAKTSIPLSVCLYFSAKCRIHPNICACYCSKLLPLIIFFPFCLLAISRALCQHTARSHTDQGQLCGAGGHCSHQGHFSQVPQQVSFLLNVNVVMSIFSKDFII